MSNTQQAERNSVGKSSSYKQKAAVAIRVATGWDLEDTRAFINSNEAWIIKTLIVSISSLKPRMVVIVRTQQQRVDFLKVYSPFRAEAAKNRIELPFIVVNIKEVK